jgi:mRNA interferase MazF
MPLLYHPKVGEILLCDYDSGFIEPEMVKRRPVVVISPRLRKRAGLVSVIPLSTTEPDELMDFHIVIELAKPLPKPFQSKTTWAKCDMISTVSLKRLDRFKEARGGQGQRSWISGQLDQHQIKRVKTGLLFGLGLGSLTLHL